MKRVSKTCLKEPFFFLVFLIAINGVRAQNLFNPAGGNVGIGTTTPNAALQIVRNSGLSNIHIDHGSTTKFKLETGDGYHTLGMLTNHPLVFATNNMERFRIAANGNVGVNTMNPRAIFDVGSINDNTLTTVLGRLAEGNNNGEGTFLGVRAINTQPWTTNSFSIEHKFNNVLNSAINFYRGGSFDGGYLTFATNNGTERLRIDHHGRLGIGTTSPNTILAISPNVFEPKLTLYDGGDNTYHYGFGVTPNQLNYHSGASHVFYTGGKNANGIEIIRMAGNSGASAIEIGNNATGNKYAYLDFVGDQTHTDYGLRIIRGNGGKDTYSNIAHRGAGEFVISLENNADFYHKINGQPRLYHSGNALVSYYYDQGHLFGIGKGSETQYMVLGAERSAAGDAYFELVGQKDGGSTRFTRTAGLNGSFFINNNGIGEFTMSTSGRFNINTTSTTRLTILSGGNVGIGTLNPSERLSVNGNIVAQKVRVTQTGWPDYVFKDNYPLLSLPDLQAFIQKNKHLPEVPNEQEIVEKGLDLGEMNAVLLKKIEELTLYILQQDKRIETLEKNQLRSN